MEEEKVKFNGSCLLALLGMIVAVLIPLLSLKECMSPAFVISESAKIEKRIPTMSRTKADNGIHHQDSFPVRIKFPFDSLVRVRPIKGSKPDSAILALLSKGDTTKFRPPTFASVRPSSMEDISSRFVLYTDQVTINIPVNKSLKPSVPSKRLTKTEGNLSYFFPSKMEHNQTFVASIAVSFRNINDAEGKIISAGQLPYRSEPVRGDDISREVVNLEKVMYAELVDPTGDSSFVIYPSGKQRGVISFDDNSYKLWKWDITARGVDTAYLRFRITSPDGSEIMSRGQKVFIHATKYQKTWYWLVTKYWFITFVMISGIGFLIVKIVEKKGAMDKKAESNSEGSSNE